LPFFSGQPAPIDGQGKILGDHDAGEEPHHQAGDQHDRYVFSSHKPSQDAAFLFFSRYCPFRGNVVFGPHRRAPHRPRVRRPPAFPNRRGLNRAANGCHPGGVNAYRPIPDSKRSGSNRHGLADIRALAGPLHKVDPIAFMYDGSVCAEGQKGQDQKSSQRASVFIISTKAA
jgi:hypothetical protein